MSRCSGNGRSSTPTRRAGYAAFAAAAMFAATAHASGIPICVSSATELNSALSTAQFVPVTIEIVQGTYDISASVWDAGFAFTPVQGGTELLGGYTGACTGRNIEVGNTVITDSQPREYGAGAIPYGDLTIEGLTWKVPTGLGFSADTDLTGNVGLPAGTTILIRRDAFLDTERGGLIVVWGQDDDVGGKIRIVDTLFAGNTEIDCSLNVEVDFGNPAVQFIHDTVVDNSGSNGSDGSGACVYNNFIGEGHGEGTLVAYNNIFFGNDTKDLKTDADVFAPQLVDNVIGPHSTPGALEIGTQSGNPHLDSDYRPIESPPSPVINTGSTTAPGGLPSTDLPGRARVIGTAPDRGAFESSVDDSFLQVVTNTNDAGSGSLRSAILGANAHGSGLISFDIGSGCGPHTIGLASPLPSITVPLIINGYTQTGASTNDLDIGTDATFCVILEAVNSSVTKGLQIGTGAGDGVSLYVKGLAFSGFSEAAIALGSGSDSVVAGNRFGGSVGSHVLAANGAGLRLDAASHDTTVGGDDPADRNIIGGSSTGSGIDMFGSLSGSTPTGTHDDQIIGNLIGVDWSGGANGAFTALGNGARGIYLAGPGNEISGNWIGSNAQSGIAVVNGGAQNNTIENNFIGFIYASTFGNGAAGIHMSGDAGDAPEANVVRYNVIQGNDGPGVWVSVGQRNRIRRNQMFDNTGLGIDLVDAGVLPNDNDGASEPQDYANRGLNYPVLTGAIGGRTTGTFSGSLESTVGDYRIDFYQSPSCSADNREGAFWIGMAPVTISFGQVGGDGTVSFVSIVGPGDLHSIGGGITATATDSVGNTSELSACMPYQDDTIFANGFEPQS